MINHQKVLDEMVVKHEEMVNLSEANLVQYALEHDLDLSLGEYGAGRTLLTRKDFIMSSEGGMQRHWSGHEIGEWLYSSETC